MAIKHLSLGLSVFCLGILIASGKAVAESIPEDIADYQTSTEGLAPIVFPQNAIDQVTNVSQMRDVQAGDWAYEALRSLVDRYGCIVGFPNQTYRGNKAITRYEFAAGLNACLQQIERLIASSDQEDLEILNKLTQEFEAELAIIAGRVDNLEGRVAFLEDHQFSTTTILNGEVIFALADAFGGNPPGGCSVLPDGTIGAANGDSDVRCFANGNSVAGDPDTNTVFANFVRLGLQTSFNGKDRLRAFLTTGNFTDGGFTNPEALNTYMARLGYQADLNNDVFLDILEYRVPAFNDRVVFYGSAFGFSLSNVLTANSPYFDIGRGAISRFGQLNPILRIGGPMDAGVGFDWSISEPIRLQVAYGTRDSGNPEGGFFGADHSALGAQILVQPTDNIVVGLNYVNAYSSDATLGTFTGSVNAETLGLWSQANIPSSTVNRGDPNFSGFGCCQQPGGDLATKINAIGGSFQWRLLDNLTFATWGGYIFSDFLDSLPNDPALGASSGQEPSAEVATFTVSLGLSDPFGREGDLFAFIFGMPPKLINAEPSTVGVPVPFFEQVISQEDATTVTDNNPNILNGKQLVGEEDEATSLHFELFYRFKVNDNIWITPGFFLVTNPGHIEENDTLYVGTIRTTFRF